MMTTTINKSNIDDDTTTTTNNNNKIRSKSNVSSSLLLRIAVGSKNPCKINAVREAIQIVIGRHHRHNNNHNHKTTTTTKKKKTKKDDDDDDDNPDDDNDNGNTIVDDDFELNIKGYSSPSGVPDQPFGDAETQLGAQNRAKHAYEAYTNENNGIQPHFAIGLEGGLEWSEKSSMMDDDSNDDDDDDETSTNNKNKTLWCMAWMAIYGEKRKQQRQSSSNNFDIVTNLMASKDCIYNNNNNNNSNDDVDITKSKLVYGLSKTGMFMLPSSISNLVESGIELGDADDQIFGRINSKHGSGTVGLLTDGLIDRSVYYEHALILALIPWIRPDVY